MESGYPKHFACTFGIASGDNRGMHIKESFVIKVLMNCKGYAVSNPKNGVKGIGTHS